MCNLHTASSLTGDNSLVGVVIWCGMAASVVRKARGRGSADMD